MEIIKNDAEIEEQKEAEAALGSDAAVLEESESDIFKYELIRPVTYDGKEYKELTFDFGSLTGGDSMDVEDELMSRGHAVLVRSADSMYLSRMCARACNEKVGADIFRLMFVKDCNRILAASRRFF